MLKWFLQRQKYIFAVIAFFLAVALVGFLYIKGPLGPTKVTVTRVRQQTFIPGVFGIGTVDARLTYNIGPTQPGRLAKVFADQGKIVAAGEVLGEMDPVDLEQKLLSAAAAETKAQNSLLVAEAHLKDADGRRRLAVANANRYNKLLTAHAISQELADVKNNEMNSAHALYESAEATVLIARSEVNRTQSEYLALQSQRDSLNLVSPANGLIVSREVEPGSTVVSGQVVFRLIDPATLWIKTRIDQGRFQGISLGQKASIVLRSKPDTPIHGRVERLEVQADSVTEERFVNVAFNSIPDKLPLGELAEVTIQFEPIADALVIPAAAIKKIGGKYGVWVLTERGLQFNSLQIGVYSLDGKVQILKGISPDDTVVVYSAQQLSEGMKVRVDKKI